MSYTDYIIYERQNSENEVPEFLIATTFDRLSRDMTDTLLIARTLRQSGVKLYIRDRGEVAMDSFADQAAIVGQAVGGHAENEAKSNRCKASWERRHRQGKPMSNKSPFGLQLRAEQDVEEPVSAPCVRQAFEWYASGIGMHTIAKRLKAGAPPHRVVTSKHDEDGLPIIRERAHVWESNRVRKILEQQRYRGTIGQPDLFDQVQEAMRSKPRWRQEEIFHAFGYGWREALRALALHASASDDEWLTKARRAIAPWPRSWIAGEIAAEGQTRDSATLSAAQRRVLDRTQLAGLFRAPHF